MKKLFLPFLLLLSALCLKTEAQIIQQFNFAGATGTEDTFAPDGQPLNGALSNMKRGSGISSNTGGGVFNSKGFTPELSPDTADYVAFAIKANVGFQLNLDSLVFGQKRSNSGVRAFSVKSSLDGFSQSLLTDSGTVAFSWNNKVITGTAFQGISSAQTLEFRIYGYNCPNTSGTWRLDSIRIYGNISQGGVVVSKPKLAFSPTSFSFAESAGPQQATLQFSAQPSVEVSAALYVKSGTVSVGSDYEGFDSIPFSFTPGGNLNFSKPVNFLDDVVAEPGESLTLVLRKTGLSSDTAYDLGPDSLFTFIISDNDVPAPVSGVLQQYNFTGANGDEAIFPPDGQPLNGALSNMKRGSGLQPSAAGNVFNSTGFTTGATADTSDYYSFSIKANTGFQLNLDSLVFGQRKSNSGPASYAIRSSQDNFQGDLSTGQGTNTISWNNKTVFGAAFTGISSDQTTEFRIYGYGATAASGTWRIDSVRIYGNISPGGGVVSKPKLGFSSSSLSFTESVGPRQATLQFSAQPSVEVSGALFVKSGTATAGTDFEGFDSIPFTFTPGGSLSFSKSVNFLDDAVTESSETLVLVARKLGLVSDTAFDLGPDSLFTFTITDNDAPAPPALNTRTIGQIRGANTGNQADSVGKSFRVFGVVYGLNQRLSTPAGGYQMFIRDATGGIGLFKNAPLPGITALNEGDSVRVMGKIECFRGLSQINIDSMVVLASGLPLKNPDVVSVLTESDESNLVKVENLTINPATWTTGAGGGGFTAKAFNGTDTIAIRIDNDCPLFNQPAPSGTVSVIGMVGQFVGGNPAPVAPFPSTGYQLIPRRVADVVSTTSLNPLCRCGEIKVSPNPGYGFVRISGNYSEGEILSISDIFGRIIGEYRLSAGGSPVDLSAVSSGIYLFRFQKSGEILRWVKE